MALAMDATLAVDGQRISYEGGRIRYAEPGSNRAPLCRHCRTESNQFAGARANTTLNASVSDDNLPTNSPPTLEWTVVEGPGSAYFDNPNQATTRVSFDRPGLGSYNSAPTTAMPLAAIKS